MISARHPRRDLLDDVPIPAGTVREQGQGRDTQHWVNGEDSIAQMKMIDMAYEKSGLGTRLTSTYR